MYTTKTTITFSFELPVNADSQASAKNQIQELVANGAINLSLPSGYKNLNLEDCSVTVKGLKNDSKDSNSELNLDAYEREIQAAFADVDRRIANNHR